MDLLGQLDANCLVLFYYSFCCTYYLTLFTLTLQCTYLYHLHVHYMTLLRMDVY